jgi:hypothetical protein
MSPLIKPESQLKALEGIKNWWMLYRMGYTSNQTGIVRRFLREEGAWEPHLQKTRNTILDSIQRDSCKSVTVLGSGWLLDVPLGEMLEQNIKVKLIDIAHPARILHRYKNNSSIEFVDCDLTGGGIVEVWNFCGRKRNTSYPELIENLRQPIHSFTLDTDLVLSVNILSQLHVQLVRFLQNHSKISSSQTSEIIVAIQQSHLNLLPKGQSVLISDYEEELYNDSGELIGVNPRLMADMELWVRNDEWKWTFDTKKMYSGDQKVILNVASYRNLKANN